MPQKKYYYGDDVMRYEESLFWTSDIGLAATLVLYYPIQTINKDNPKRMSFGFESTPALQDMVKQYWAQELKVEPQDYYLRLMQLRSRINQEGQFS